MNESGPDPKPAPERGALLAWSGFLALLVLSVFAEFGVSMHPHFELDALPGFHAAYALLAGAVIISIARIIGALLRRSQAYYEVDDE